MKRDFRETVTTLSPTIESSTVGSAALTPSDMSPIIDPHAGVVDYIIDGLIPRRGVVLIAAGWKTGKTLLVYRLLIDAVFGRDCLGYFEVDRPLRVGVFQFEMPLIEDHRRLRRLALGADMDPQTLLDAMNDGRWLHFNRPDLNFNSDDDRKRFHDAVLGSNRNLVLVDSAGASCAGGDGAMNDNDRVNEIVRGTFDPLTSAGVSVVLLHHKRKTTQGGKKDDAKAAVLGAQAWGSASDRTYNLDTYNADDPRTKESDDFHLQLVQTGSWTPGEADHLLWVRDTDNDGTSVEILDRPGQLRAGGVTKMQQASIAFARMVRDGRRVLRSEALLLVEGEVGCSDKPVKKGLDRAAAEGWVQLVPSTLNPGNNRMDLIEGSSPMGDL